MEQKSLDIMKFKLNQPALIEASAGTGKTYTITNLVLRILLGSGDQTNSLERPLPIDSLLVVTFTRVATSDLRRRIYERIRMAHVLFENFLEVALQELKKKARELASKELKSAQRAVKAAALHPEQVNEEHNTTLQEQQDLLSRLDLTLPEDELIEQFCELFIHDDSFAPKLSEQLAKFQLNVETIARKQLKCDDDFLIQLLKQIADKDAIKAAIAVLIRAERNIDDAAICTIHSFCNRTLTQIYAFEANEAFSNELTNDLSLQYQEAANTVWRKLFYKLSSTPAVLKLLNIHSPEELGEVKNNINSVHLSQDKEGVFGYELLNFKLPGFKQTIDIAQDYALDDVLQRLFFWVEILEIAQYGMIFQSYEQWRTQYFEESKGFINLQDQTVGPLLWNDKKTNTFGNDAARAFGRGFADMEDVYQSVATNSELKVLLQQNADLVGKLLQADHVLDCEELQFIYKAMQQLNLNQVFSETGLLDAAADIVRSNLDYKYSALLRGNDGRVKTPEYQAFHAHMVELVAAVRQEQNRLSALKPALSVLLAMQINQQLQDYCIEHHLMSNDDLLRRLDQALQRPGFGDRLAHLIRMRYPLAMIDEFQDTDPIQYSIFSKIYLNKTALKEKAYCYLIGDPKQSIYAFRGSDINSYLKARHAIKQLTHNHGISTLNVNYRSTDDVINACNALFDTTLNPENASPFKELDIPFEPVGSHKKRKSAADVAASVDVSTLQSLPVDSEAMAKAWGSSFVIENMQDLGLLNLSQEQGEEAAQENKENQASSAPAAQEPATQAGNAAVASAQTTSSVAGDTLPPDLPQALANTYVVKFHDTFNNKTELQYAYAQAAALLIKKILKDGKIIEKGQARAVKPSDIALLVRSQDQNNILQKALKDLGISSVYFSDRSSVLISDSGQPTNESKDLLYLMEAMSDPANRSKVMRVLGSGLLCLSSAEFLEHSSGLCFEREVLCLKRCAQIWDKYGFMPAFMQWCNHHDHQVTARLLSIINGERALTNYNQISELIQGAHQQHTGIKAQIRWFYDMLYSGQLSIDAESAQKRLDSEHEQIKILTIHKSKGLEFPIVFMPFLWSGVFVGNVGGKKQLDVAKYYSSKVKQRVLDFDNHPHILVPNVEQIALDKLKIKQSQSHEVTYDFAEFEYALNKEAELQFVADDEAILAESTEADADNAESKSSASVKDTEQEKSKSASKVTRARHSVVPEVELERLTALASAEATTTSGQRLTQSQLVGESEDKDSPQGKRPYLLYTPQGFERYEEAKERMRLLYVAVTRARLANFFFVADFKVRSSSTNEPSALMELLGIKETKDMNIMAALEPLERNTQLFTMVNGERCVELFNESVDSLHFQASNLTLSSTSPEIQERKVKLQAKLDELIPLAKEQGEVLRKQYEEQHKQSNAQYKFVRKARTEDLPYKLEGNDVFAPELYAQICNLRQELELLNVNNVPVLDSSNSQVKFEPCAMSFAYDGAIDESFNIMSYSRLTHGHDPVKKAMLGQDYLSKHNADEDGALDIQGVTLEDGETCSLESRGGAQETSAWLQGVQETGVGTLVGGNLYRDYAPKAHEQLQKMQSYASLNDLTQHFTLNEYIQYHWDAGKFFRQGKWQERPQGLNFSFPCGAEPGTFLHESLRYVNFDEIQSNTTQNKEEFLGRNLKEKITVRSDLGPIFRKAKLDLEFTRFTDWLINIVEAPIIKGRYQNLALADLQANSYIAEMNFLMTSKRFAMSDIDVLCQDMARQLLPESMYGVIDELVLSQDELFGFITGSLDLACRFDLNYRGDLDYRADLFNELNFDEHEAFAAAAQHKQEKEQDLADKLAPDHKYYVIDYKSNILGNEFENYSTANMLQAIYSHRYDVQFLFYTLAMFRILKRRMALGFDVSKEEQRKFYDANIGGVIYLYLRGLKGDYLRRAISPGVFSIKIDFEYVYRLDQIFGSDEEWS